MNMKILKTGMVGVLLLLTSAAFAQTTDTLRLSLVEAVNLAIRQNPQLQSVQLDEEINLAKVKKVKASALPQVNADASYTDNFLRASQILPGEVFGRPGESIAVKFGTRYQMGANAQISQTLYNPALNIGLKAAKASQGLYELQTFKSKEDLIYNVINLYMQLQMVEKQTELVESNLDRTQRLIDITGAQFKEGIVKKVDVDQLRVSYTNLTTQLSNVANSRVQLLNNLKTLMNVDSEQAIAITDVGTDPIPVSQELNLDANIDLALVDYQRKLQDLNTASIRAGYLPSLSLIANFGYQAQTNQLLDKTATQGFASGLYGLRLSIPIFDGFAKKSKITQSQYKVHQLELNRKYLMRNVENQFVNARNNVQQNQRVLLAQQENMKLAEQLYNVAKLSYTEGISPLSELINAENGLKEAQNQYLTAMLQINLAELDLMQSSGQLTQIIKQALPFQN
ncbi:transporter [Persicitalea jodogahamensis]|uniref:Transporter n=2 Tax=Persicitalea jodogahamensis TaxID=402147 RepID=A0A8J3G9Y0_9BACT|nr:transporter [Persicitalea jodogahamensis]